MVKQSLRSNNRALAKALETVKRAYASLLQQHIDLKSEHQAALSKLSHLEAVTTMKNEQIDREVDRRIQVGSEGYRALHICPVVLIFYDNYEKLIKMIGKCKSTNIKQCTSCYFYY